MEPPGIRTVTWTIRLLVFARLVAFGAKNADPGTLRFYFDLSIQTPLILALFAAFRTGAFFGVLSLLGRVLRQRREISFLRRKGASAESAPPAMPPSF